MCVIKEGMWMVSDPGHVPWVLTGSEIRYAYIPTTIDKPKSMRPLHGENGEQPNPQWCDHKSVKSHIHCDKLYAISLKMKYTAIPMAAISL